MWCLWYMYQVRNQAVGVVEPPHSMHGVRPNARYMSDTLCECVTLATSDVAVCVALMCSVSCIAESAVLTQAHVGS